MQWKEWMEGLIFTFKVRYGESLTQRKSRGDGEQEASWQMSKREYPGVDYVLEAEKFRVKESTRTLFLLTILEEKWQHLGIQLQNNRRRREKFRGKNPLFIPSYRFWGAWEMCGWWLHTCFSFKSVIFRPRYKSTCNIGWDVFISVKIMASLLFSLWFV